MRVDTTKQKNNDNTKNNSAPVSLDPWPKEITFRNLVAVIWTLSVLDKKEIQKRLPVSEKSRKKTVLYKKDSLKRRL